jgi:tetratricopeptide (TPR) repeat protein
VCVSRKFNQKGFRQKEVRIALEEASMQPEGEIFVIPARLEECDNLESLSRWHWVDLFEIDGFEHLMRALRLRAKHIGASLNPISTILPGKTRTKTPISEVLIIGREKLVDDFYQWVRTFDRTRIISDNVLLVCIWGFGGVGKTTLLKKFGEICGMEKWFIIGKSGNNSTFQIPGLSEPLSVFLNRIHQFANEHGANEFETISKFVTSLPLRSALLVDEFRPDDKDFVNSFEWMIAQMATQIGHRYLIITTCRPRPRFNRAQVDYYVGTEKGLPPLTKEKTQEYLDFYWRGDQRNKYINEIFHVTGGNPKVINYLYASPEISEKILSHQSELVLDESAVIRATWEYVYGRENLRQVANLAATIGKVSIACPNDIFDRMVENWYELKTTMLDQSLLEQVGPDTYKLHDLLRDYHYDHMRNTDKKQHHQEVGSYYEKIKNLPVVALRHFVLAEAKGSFQRVYNTAYKEMERNSDFKSIIHLAERYIELFNSNDEFGIDIVTDQGMSYRILTDYQSALSKFEQALLLCNNLGILEYDPKRATILWGLGETYRRLDRYNESLEYYNKSLEVYRTYDIEVGKDGIAKCERGKSAVYKMISRYSESIQGYIIASDIYMQKDNLDGQLYCERGIAAVHMLQGLYDQARKGYEHSLQLYRKTNNPRGIAYACWGYAESYRLQGEVETAIEIYNESLELSKKIGDDWGVIYLSFNLGECYRAKRNFEKTREWYESVKQLGTYKNSVVLQAHYLLATAELHRLEGKADIMVYRQAEQIYQKVQMGLRWGIVHCKIGIGLLELSTNQPNNMGLWIDWMNSVALYCDQNKLPAELVTTKRIITEQDPNELHPLSFP